MKYNFKEDKLRLFYGESDIVDFTKTDNNQSLRVYVCIKYLGKKQ